MATDAEAFTPVAYAHGGRICNSCGRVAEDGHKHCACGSRLLRWTTHAPDEHQEVVVTGDDSARLVAARELASPSQPITGDAIRELEREFGLTRIGRRGGRRHGGW